MQADVDLANSQAKALQGQINSLGKETYTLRVHASLYYDETTFLKGQQDAIIVYPNFYLEILLK